MSLWGLWFVIGHEQLSLLIMGAHYKLEGVYKCQDDISLSTHSKVMLKNPNAPYMSIIG